MFGWDGQLTLRQTAEIAAAKRVIYDAFVARSGGRAKAEDPIHLDIMEGHFVPNYLWARRSYSLSDASLVSHQFLEDPSGRSSRRSLAEILMPGVGVHHDLLLGDARRRFSQAA